MKNKYDLNLLAETYNIDNAYEQYKRLEFLKKLNEYINLENSNVLEFGSAMGHMTEMLSKISKNVLAIDGSKKFIEIAKRRLSKLNNVKFEESYFEDLKINEKYDCLIMHHILEHLDNPTKLLSKAKSIINDNGIIVILVPNAYALSRQLAVKMNLISSVYDLTENDKNHGHYRVYDWQELENQIEKAGFNIVKRHGLSFKLFSDKQNVQMIKSKIISDDQIKGLWDLGDEIKEFAGAIMIIAKKYEQ